MSKQAILYSRYSPRPAPKSGANGDAGHDCESIEVQVDRLEAFCRANDFEIVGRYEDRLKSGKSQDGREGLAAALKHVCRIRGVLVVYDYSRLSRDVPDSLDIVRRLRKSRADLRSVLDAQATDTASGELTFTITAAINQFNRRVTAEKTSDSMIRHQYSGGRLMSRRDRTPYGWRCVNGSELEQDPEEQTIIKRIIALSAEGLTYREITAALDAEGIQRRNKKWTGGHPLIGTILARAGTS